MITVDVKAGLNIEEASAVKTSSNKAGKRADNFIINNLEYKVKACTKR